jgi:putative flippase GtrA
MMNKRTDLSTLLIKKSIFDSSETRIQFVKFLIIGVINTGIHYVAFLFLYRIVGIDYLFASALGYSVGLINSFILNKKLTFKTKGVRTGAEFVKFFCVNMVALLVNLLALKSFVDYASLIPEVAQVCAIAFSTFVNFLGNKCWTFRSIT